MSDERTLEFFSLIGPTHKIQTFEGLCTWFKLLWKTTKSHSLIKLSNKLQRIPISRIFHGYFCLQAVLPTSNCNFHILIRLALWNKFFEIGLKELVTLVCKGGPRKAWSSWSTFSALPGSWKICQFWPKMLQFQPSIQLEKNNTSSTKISSKDEYLKSNPPIFVQLKNAQNSSKVI